jgi:methylenetetrahydrofolate reductase (NADPH)
LPAIRSARQFGFNPEAICSWDGRLTAEGITLPVHVGIAGPTPLAKLIKFALQCGGGVGASMHSVMKNMGAMTNLARLATSPDEMLLRLIRGRAAYEGSRLVQPHFYAFGGTMATATWLRGVADGSFTVQPDGRKFIVNGS